jgi:transposase
MAARPGIPWPPLYEEWYQGSVLSRLWKAKESELSSQRFWDHMDQVEAHHIEEIQKDVLARLAERFPLGGDTILYDATNFFTYIDTFNERTQLAQRGNNKQKRSDLRQISLALFEDQETSLPLYHQCYEGNRTDPKAFPLASQAFLEEWLGALDRKTEQLTLVFDRGNPSKENLRQLDELALRSRPGALPGVLGRWRGPKALRLSQQPSPKRVNGLREERQPHRESDPPEGSDPATQPP